MWLQALLYDMASRADEKAKLHPLVQKLTSDLSTDNKERVSLLRCLGDLESGWNTLQQDLRWAKEYNLIFLMNFNNNIFMYF